MRQGFKSALAIMILICVASGSEMNPNQRDYEQEKKPWSQIQRFQGQWNEDEVLPPIGPCDPCQYMIQLLPGKINVVIYRVSNPDNIFIRDQQYVEQDTFVFLERQIHLQNNYLRTDIKFQPRDGYRYSIEFSYFVDGLYIKHKQTRYKYFIPFLVVFHTFISFFIYRLEKERLSKFMEQALKRSSTPLILMYAQIGTILTCYQFFILIQYLIHYQHFLGKIFSYSLMISGILLMTIQTGYMYAVLQKRLQVYFPQVPDNIDSIKRRCYRLSIFLIIFVLGLLMYPLLLTFFHKQIWFSYFCLIGLILQFALSKAHNILPFKKLTLAYLLQVLFLTLLSSYYPVLNFHEANRISLTIFFFISISLFMMGHWWIERSVKQVSLRDQGLNYKQGRQKNSFSMKTEEMIRSDIQLEHPSAI